MMDNSKSRLVFAGLVTGMSSAAIYYWYSKRKPDPSLNKNPSQTNDETDDRSSSATTTTSVGVNVTRADTATSIQQDDVPKQNGRGLTILLSSSIIKLFVLAHKIKSAGLNIISWDRLVETDKNSNQTCEGSFLYGRYRYRCAQDLATGRTFLLQKCSSDITVRPEEGETVSDGIPPVSEIFPMSVLKRVGVCHDPFFREDDDSEDDSTSEFITRKSSGKVVRVIRSSRHHDGNGRSEESSMSLNDLPRTSVVQTYQPSSCSSGLVRVGRTGSDFGEMYNSVYTDFHAADTPITPVVLYNDHNQ